MVSDIPNITADEVPVRQLWVDGVRAPRMNVDGSKFGFVATPTGFTTTTTVDQSWVDNQVEFRWPSQIKNWIEPRCVVTGKSLIFIPPGVFHMHRSL